MQANPQNTRQLFAMQSEELEWWATGFEWSLCNLGPGRLWFNYSGQTAAIGSQESTELRAGFSFTHTESSNRFMELTLQAAEALTYTLITNQRLPDRFAQGIAEAAVDDTLYVRKNATWAPLAGPAAVLQLHDLWHEYRLLYRLVGGGEFLELLGNLQRFKGAEIMPGMRFLLGILPEGFRPALSVQFATCYAGSKLGPPQRATLTLESNGNLSVFVSVPANSLYISHVFNLTLV